MRRVGEGRRVPGSDDDRVGKGVRFPERGIDWVGEVQEGEVDSIGESGRLVYRIRCGLVELFTVFNTLCLLAAYVVAGQR